MDGHVLFPWFPVKKKNVTPCAKQDTLLLVVLMREKRLAITTFHLLQIPKEKQLCVVGRTGSPAPLPPSRTDQADLLLPVHTPRDLGQQLG